MMYGYLNNKEQTNGTFDHTIHLDYLKLTYIGDFHYQKVEIMNTS